jgi:thiol-disulfide isomerase/thioredoxin
MTNTLKATALLSLLLLIGAGCTPNTPTQTDTMMKDGNTTTDMMQSDTDAMMKGDVSLEGDMVDGSMDVAGGTMPAGQEMKDDDTMVGGDAMKGDDAMQKPEDTMMKDDTMVKGSYTAYTADNIAEASAQHDVVLFFHASWCPTCKALNSALESATIPNGLTILKTDYDTNTDLKKKYGVTYQHTLVQVDANGNMIKKWSGGNTLESVVSQVQ